MKPVTIGVVGIGGYGRRYMAIIKTLEEEGVARLRVAVIRNRAKYAEQIPDLEKRGVIIRGSLEEMLEKDGADLGIVAIPTGIAEHHPMLIGSLEAGCDVMMEKPPTATIQEMDEMIAAVERTGHWCQIGYQNQARVTVRSLKRMICDGRLGAIRRVAMKGAWVRRDSYYDRNPWAGRLRDRQGRWVLDGTVNNPMSHYLMNALYFAKQEWGSIATPVRVRAELYHAHEIESEDTSALEIETAEGPEVYFFGTLAGEKNTTITIEVVGERGTAVWPASGDVEIRYVDGSTEKIEDPGEGFQVSLFRNALLYRAGEATELDCPLAMTRSVVLATDGAFLSAGRPRPIDAQHLNIYHDDETNSRATEIRGIGEIIDRAFAERKLYSDLGVPWAEATEPVSVEGLTEFHG